MALFVAVRVLSSGLKCGMVVSQAYVADVSATAGKFRFRVLFLYTVYW